MIHDFLFLLPVVLLGILGLDLMIVGAMMLHDCTSAQRAADAAERESIRFFRAARRVRR